MDHRLLCKDETFIPAGTSSVDLAKFMPGDSTGETRRRAAVDDANLQIELYEPGSVKHRLYALQKALINLPDVEFPLQHTFAPGVYARTIFIPAGSVLVGKIHKHRHLNILSMGHVSVLTEGGGLEDLHGPITMVSEPGTKRAVQAHSDVVWTTIHLTNETDLAKIEDEVIAKTFDDYVKFLGVSK